MESTATATTAGNPDDGSPVAVATAAAASKEYLLQFENYAHFLTSGADSSRSLENFVDVSLVSESSKVHKAHRVILSACSPYFSQVLSHPDLPKWQHPVLMLKDIPETDLSNILQFVYLGKVHVRQDRFDSFLKSAKILKIRGLTTTTTAAASNLAAKNCNKNVDRLRLQPKKKKKKKSDKTVAETTTSPPSPPTTTTTEEPEKPPPNKRPRRSSVVTATITPANAKNDHPPHGGGGGGVVVMVKNEPQDLSEESTSAILKKMNDGGSKSEHLVIPADPNLMQGLDSNSVEDDDDIGGGGDDESARPSAGAPPPFVDRVQDRWDATAAKQQQRASSSSSSKNSSSMSPAAVGGGGGGFGTNNLVVLFSEKGRCHFCRLLCPDVVSLRNHLETVHQPPRHALCQNCENFFHICAIQRHRQRCTETYQSEKN